MKLREKFMTVCAGCDGDGKVENEVFQMGEVKYYYTQCDCENGKEFDWRKVDDEIKDTKLKIEINQMSVDNYNQFMREAMRNKDESKAIIALKLLIDKESEIEELELYLAELEEIQ
jgi:excinuclease UvrABC ATPase subunit